MCRKALHVVLKLELSPLSQTSFESCQILPYVKTTSGAVSLRHVCYHLILLGLFLPLNPSPLTLRNPHLHLITYCSVSLDTFSISRGNSLIS